MEIFQSEIEAGLETAIANDKSIAFLSLINSRSNEVIKDNLFVEKVRAANQNQIDLHYLKTILVTTGCNLNDDVFHNLEAWRARKTPEDKPFNFEHNEKDIIGHITDNYVVDDDGKLIADDTKEEDLPQKFHIVTNAVIYAHWSDEKLKERMGEILKDISNGKWYVSMEALFSGFDYSLIEDGGTEKIVARCEQTAHLTKHLRAYGGTGEYKGSKVRRLIRNITFSGKGLVRKPANPESIIFNSLKTNDLTLANLENKMSADLEKKIDELKAENKDLKTQLKSFDEKVIAEIKKEAADLKIKNDELVASKKTLDEAKTKADSDLSVAVKLKEEAYKAMKAANEELAKIKSEQLKKNRIDALIQAGETREDAEKRLEALGEVNDEVFKTIVDITKSAFDFKKMLEDKKKKEEKKTDATTAGEKVLENLEKEEEIDLSTAGEVDGNKKILEETSAYIQNIFNSKKKKLVSK